MEKPNLDQIFILKVAFVLSLFMLVNNTVARNRIEGTATAESEEQRGALLLKGESIVTNSDIDGNFSLTGINAESVFQFSLVGMITQRATEI